MIIKCHLQRGRKGGQASKTMMRLGTLSDSAAPAPDRHRAAGRVNWHGWHLQPWNLTAGCRGWSGHELRALREFCLSFASLASTAPFWWLVHLSLQFPELCSNSPSSNKAHSPKTCRYKLPLRHTMICFKTPGGCWNTHKCKLSICMFSYTLDPGRAWVRGQRPFKNSEILCIPYRWPSIYSVPPHPGFWVCGFNQLQTMLCCSTCCWKAST